MTADEVKTLLGITVATHDARITAMLPGVEAFVREYCRNAFETIPANVQLVIADLVQYRLIVKAGLSGKKLGDGSETYTNGFPDSILEMLPRSVTSV